MEREEERKHIPETIVLSKQIIIFIGPEGSGKSTMANKLAQLSGKPYVSVGNILREMKENDKSELGDAVRNMFEHHAYLEWSILKQIIDRHFSQETYKNGFILDGGLRTLEETSEFWSMLQRTGRVMPVIVVHLRIPGWQSLERLTGEDGRKREDDTVEGVLSRLKHYYEDLGKRASIIRNQSDTKLIHIDATGSKNDTFIQIMQSITRA